MRPLLIAALSLPLATAAVAAPDDVKGVAAAHEAYVAAINSNDRDRILGVLTDDIVYQAPGEPEIVGKAAVGKWVDAYLAGYHTHWEKTAIGVTVSGDWAFERYTFAVTDKERKTGLITKDSGKGINVFHHDADGKWRVAIDGWSSNTPSH